MARGPAGETSSSSTSAYYTLPDVTAFSILAKRALTDALDKISGGKTLVLDASLAGPLGLVAEMSLLRDHGVDKLFWLEPGALSQAQKNIVYICRPEIGLMNIIADQIKAAPAVLNHTYTILFTPRITSVCTNMLEELGVLGSIELLELPMSLIPLEKDVLSMELGPQNYKDIFLDSNYDSISEMARSLTTLQRAFGLIPRILGKGDAARRLVDIMYRLRKETPSAAMSGGPAASAYNPSYGQIDSMIILDRQVDMVTPLATQLTYEGLIDELVGPIKNSFIEIDQNLITPSNVPPTPSSSTASHFSGAGNLPPRKKKYLLSTLPNPSYSPPASAPTASGAPPPPVQQQGSAGPIDPLFGELRDRNFTTIGASLNRIAKKINEDYENRHQAQTVTQIREFVGKLSALQAEHQALRLHTGLTELIMQTTSSDEFNRTLEVQQNLMAGLDLNVQESSIRELVYQEAPLNTVLRLLCLLSLVSGGIKPKTLEDFKRDILQTYGFEYLPLLISLSDLNLLVKNGGSVTASKSVFSLARKSLKLINDEVDESNPEDISYTYSGYSPVSIRLVQNALGLGNTSGGFVNSNGTTGGPGARERNGASVVGWRGLDEIMRTLPGAVFDETQKSDDGATGRSLSYVSDQVPVTVVCFIGGCTYTEIAALRFTSQRLSGRKLLIVTTGILNGNTIMDILGPPKRSQ